MERKDRYEEKKSIIKFSHDSREKSLFVSKGRIACHLALLLRAFWTGDILGANWNRL